MKEFDLIEKIRKPEKIKDKKVIKGIGDDSAVIDRGDNYELITTDMLVEGDHFRLDWSTPFQVGMKSAEVNLSDIAAMGGIPKYCFVSLCLSKEVGEEWVKEFYRGMRKKLRIMNYELRIDEIQEVLILGGDVTHGEKVVINICLIGEVEKDRCVFRSGAKIGDLLCVTGELGGSTAGLELLKLGVLSRELGEKNKNYKLRITNYEEAIKYCLKKHLEPRAKLKEGRILSRYASAMIDVSDGLGSEVRHICEESCVGARVYAKNVPINENVKKMGEYIKKFQVPKSKFQINFKYQIPNFKTPLFIRWAMSGGEDFELMFTISKKKLAKLNAETPKLGVCTVGEIVSKKNGIKFIIDGKEKEMPKGFEHF